MVCPVSVSSRSRTTPDLALRARPLAAQYLELRGKLLKPRGQVGYRVRFSHPISDFQHQVRLCSGAAIADSSGPLPAESA